MEIIVKGDPGYKQARKISNARFNYLPAVICYPESAGEVRDALQIARDKKLRVRIRSGGHQHEGMCSANGVLIVDVSKISHISFSSDNRHAWIGPGAKLGDVYKIMAEKKRIFPGGGCGDVRVGGLVQGGGWGPYLRYLGLTCDRLTGVRLVTAKGKLVEVTGAQGDPNGRLLWAIRGGGGGNFGVAIDFRFDLAAQEDPITPFTLAWKDQQIVHRVVEEWRKGFPDDRAHKLTSFCRLTVTGKGGDDPPVLIGGSFLGSQAELCSILKRLLPGTFPLAEPNPCSPGVEAPMAPAPPGYIHPEYQPGPPLEALQEAPGLLEAAPGGLNDTCAGVPFPHKVSSAFPKAGFGETASKTMSDFVAASEQLYGARLYLSLHCLGGAARQGADRSAFPFRDKPFMLQYQAWWADKDNLDLGRQCIAWIHSFRETMDGSTEGAFINFPDKDLVANPETPEGRKKLLRIYYQKNLEGLIAVKNTWDHENFFDFEMGIPTA